MSIDLDKSIDFFAKAEGPPNIVAEHKAQVEAFQKAQQKPIAVGDVVALPSGGKLMTVMKVLDGGQARVAWFDEKDELHQTFVDVAGLKRRAS